MNLRNSLSARSRWPAINILLYNFPERKRKKKSPFCLLKVSTRLEVFKAATMRCHLGLRTLFDTLANECAGLVSVGIRNTKFALICLTA